MKKLILLFTFLGIGIGLFAQLSKTVDLATAGTLSTVLTSNELQTVTHLTLTGTIDARDFKTMRDDMPALAEINISEVTIVAYSGDEGTVLFPWNFPANTLPDYAFKDKNAWDGKTNLTSILLPQSITELGAYCFTRCTGLTSIVIPSSVNSIGAYAFYNCSGLTTVSIPPAVTYIGAYSFGECSKLSSFVIPSSVTSIEEGTFRDCSSLTIVSIPSFVTSIGKFAFAGCYFLTSVTIPSSVTTIGASAFVFCPRLSSIIIPSSVTSIGFSVFEDCGALIEVDVNNQNYSSLEGVLYNKAQTTLIRCSQSKSGRLTIPPTVTTINNNAFLGCPYLTTVNIPSSVKTIGEKAFYSCYDITSIVIPPSVTTIAASTFMYCTSLTSITIPPTVTTIGDSAFAKCSRLQTMVIPPSVTTIGNNAYDGCSNLDTISIPSSVISIGLVAFGGCWGLIDVDLNNPNYSSLNNVIYNKDKTKIIQCRYSKTDKFVIPSSVTSIGNSAFWGCTSLSTISIPSSVISIDDGAFGCSGLTALIAANPIPVNLSATTYLLFTNVNIKNCTLYVPIGSKSAYQAAPVWKDFGRIVEMEFTGIDQISNEKQLTAYPNPTSGEVKLKFSKVPARGIYITVFDITGKTILQQLVQEEEHWIDLKGNPTGLYFIKTDQRNQSTRKLILK